MEFRRKKNCFLPAIVLISWLVHIVRPGNGRWACQIEHCHSLSISTVLQQHRYALTLKTPAKNHPKIPSAFVSAAIFC